ncbi:tryptophan-rich sensory protein [Billgrantia bachuensis]|uniref:Uncharacterized protein n=1 Tax=Billgrantia bachuensis TaxID=2717286 RepID=A0ABX0PVN6_9GAMM|nr:tryptophan-rich sensory protein [Halomonas bachuensis]NIC07019.1 hypothetical protein [Halomonas bachuensis]
MTAASRLSLATLFGWLLVPYLAWVGFAGFLNAGGAERVRALPPAAMSPRFPLNHGSNLVEQVYAAHLAALENDR